MSVVGSLRRGFWEWVRAGSISRRLVLIVALLCAGALLAAAALRRDDEARLRETAEGATGERTRLVRALVSAEGDRIHGYIENNGAWDEMAAYVAHPTPGWAERNMGITGRPPSIAGVYLYDRTGRLARALVRPKTGLGRWHPAKSVRLSGHVGARRPFHTYFERLPDGLVEVSLTTIAPSGDDARHRGVVLGYIASARRWNPAALDGLARLTATKVDLLPRQDLHRRDDAREDRFVWNEPLKDAEGRTIAYRRFSANSPVVAQYRISLMRTQAFLVLLIIAGLAALGVVLGALVARPLRRMRRAVAQGHTGELGQLLEDGTEIGEQARLIEDWFLMKNELVNTNVWLEGEIRERTREVNDAYLSTIRALVTALEYRDQETKGHCERVTAMTETIGRALRLSEIEIDDMKRGALLHDIGKIAIPDSILLKPGALTLPERAMMETHAHIGWDMLKDIRFLERALDIPRSHHEKWDGSGYPRGLAGEDIPMAARIFALADVWDALSSSRPYRKAWPPERVREHLIALSGTHFDPTVVAAFERLPLTAFPTEFGEEGGEERLAA